MWKSETDGSGKSKVVSCFNMWVKRALYGKNSSQTYLGPKISTLFWCTGRAWNRQIIFRFASIHIFAIQGLWSAPLHPWQIKSEFRVLEVLFSIRCSSGWLRPIKMCQQNITQWSHVEKEKCKQWRHVEKTVDFVMNLCPPNTEERYLQKLSKYLLN